MAMWPTSWITAEACGRTAKDLFPNCTEVDNQCFCSNEGYLKTVVECIVSHTSPTTSDSADAWDHFLQNYCDLKNAPPVTRDLYDLVSNEDAYHPVSTWQYIHGYRAMYNHLQQKDTGAIQGGVLVGYWLVLPLCAASLRIFRSFARYLGSPSIVKKPGKYMVALQRHVLMPALYKNRHMRRLELSIFKFSMGTRFETILILLYILLTVIFMLCPYTFMDMDPFYDTRWKQMMRYSSDRSGILATVQFPLLVLFATRNNILIWLSGWSYASFNRFHRAISRVVYALLIIHSINKHIFSASYGSSLVLYFYPLPYYRYGVAAMFLFAIMILFAQIRHRFYELFLVLHLMCAFGGIIMSIYHLVGIGYQQPLYICLSIWGLDIVVRGLRLFVFNYSVFLAPLVGHRKISYGTMKVYHQELTSVSANLPVRWRYYPGQYVYLHLSPWSFLTGGHPFSVVGENQQKDGLEIIFKARQGFTRVYKNKLTQLGCTPDTPVTLPVYIEGPYGVSAPVQDYGEAILFAGGIGITGILGYIEKLSEPCPDTPYRKILVVWTVPKREDFKPFVRHIYRLQTLHPIEFQLYCRGIRKEAINITLAEVLTTSPATFSEFGCSNFVQLGNASTTTLDYYNNLIHTHKEDVEGSSSSMDGAETAKSTSGLSNCLFSGRPDIPGLVQNFFAESHSNVCVVSCGPASMVDQVRASVCDYMEEALHGKVSYFEEAFEW